MFQKHPDGDYGVLRLENDASKKFGITYWGFAFNSNNYEFKIQLLVLGGLILID